MKISKNLIASAVFMAITSFASSQAMAEAEITLQFANTANQAGKDAAGLLKQYVNEKTGGALDIHLYNDNSFADDRVWF